MEQNLFYATIITLVLVVLFWIVNLILLGIRQQASVWLSRGVYVSGIICAVCNAIRTFITYEQYKGFFVFAHIVVVVCILIAFVRWERSKDSADDGAQ